MNYIKLSNEDLDFLIRLKDRLNTQKNDYQAHPVFWGIGENKRIYGVDENYEYDGVSLVDYDLIFDCSDEDFDNFLEYILENYEEEYDKKYSFKNSLRNIMEDFYDVESIHEWSIVWLKEFGYNFQKVYYRNNHEVSKETGCFLTKEECIKHIKSNRYHYKNPHPYAMTAWRNREFERLIDIVRNIEFKEGE